jgi:hypothetical protein
MRQATTETGQRQRPRSCEDLLYVFGVGGERINHWNNWSASVSGIAQFHPNGAPNTIPWTWGPITIPGGQSTYAVGVYEIVYWVGGKPDYQWQYVNDGPVAAPAAGGGHLYCAY